MGDAFVEVDGKRVKCTPTTVEIVQPDKPEPIPVAVLLHVKTFGDKTEVAFKEPSGNTLSFSFKNDTDSEGAAMLRRFIRGAYDSIGQKEPYPFDDFDFEGDV